MGWFSGDDDIDPRALVSGGSSQLPPWLRSFQRNFQVLRLFVIWSFYLAANLVLLWLPLVAYLAYEGWWVARFFWIASVVDYLVPLSTPSPWMKWWRLTDDTVGKEIYFDVQIVCEMQQPKKDSGGTAEGNDKAVTTDSGWSVSDCFSPSRNYLLVYHPHALFGHGYNLVSKHLLLEFGAETLFTGADATKRVPLLRRLLAWWGWTPVGASEMKKNLGRPYPQNVLTLFPGGIAEMFYGLEEEQVVVRKRYGFCKLALETGCSLVPVYAMGSNSVYTRYFGPSSWLAGLSSRLQFSFVFWTDHLGIPFGVVPRPGKMVLCIGKPIDVERVETPTPLQVAKLQERYILELRALFNRHRGKMGHEWEGRELYLEDEELPTKKKAGGAGGPGEKTPKEKKID